jgi:hypothetical protein
METSPQSQIDINQREQFLIQAEQLMERARTFGISAFIAIDPPHRDPIAVPPPYLITSTTIKTSDAILFAIVGLTAPHPGILTTYTEDGPC